MTDSKDALSELVSDLENEADSIAAIDEGDIVTRADLEYWAQLIGAAAEALAELETEKEAARKWH